MQNLQQKTSRFFGTILVLLLIVYNNVSAQKNLFSLIPNQALFITTVHSGVITEKLPWEEFAKYQFVEEFARSVSGALDPEDQDMIREAMLNPVNYGVDIKQSSYGFLEVRPEEGTFATYLFKINDAGKFKGLMDAYFGSNINSLLKKQDAYLVIYKDNLTIAWQKDHALISFANIERDYYYDESEEDYEGRLKKAMENYLIEITTLSNESSLQSNSQFINWEKNVRDAGSWVNYRDVMRLMNENNYGMYGGGYGGMMSNMIPMLMELYGEMSIGSDIAFEKGAIYSDNLIYVDKDLMEFSVKAANRKANKRFLQYMDGEKTIAYMSSSFSPEGLYKGWKELLMKKAGPIGADAVKDLFGIMEIFMDEKASFNFLKGDLLMAFNGIKSQKVTEIDYIYNPDTDNYEEEEVTVDRSIPMFTVAFSYGKKEDMMKFIRIFSTLGLLREGKGGLYEGGGSSGSESFGTFYLKLDKGMMVISNDEDRMVNGKKYKPMAKEHLDIISQNTQAVYFSPSKMVDAIIATEESIMPDQEIAMKEFQALFGDMKMLTHRPKSSDIYMKQSFSLDLKNKEINSLKLLFDFINKQYLNTMKGT